MKSITRLILCIFAITAILTACGEQTKFGRAKELSAPPPPAPMMAESVSDSNQRKVIHSAELTVEIDDIKIALEKAQSITIKTGGFVVDSRSSEDDSGVKNLHLTINIPTDKLENTVSAFKMLGKVKQENIKGEDITEQYIDLESRLNNSKLLETRIKDLTTRESKSLKDVLDAEKELARVREDIDSMEAKKRYYDTHTSLSTIELELIQPAGFFSDIFHPLSSLIERSLSSFTSSFAWLVVAVCAVAPWAGVLLLASWLAIRYLKWLLRHKREEKTKKNSGQ